MALPLPAQVGLGLTPMRLEFPAVSDKSYSGTLMLNNSAANRVRVRTELLDFFVDENQTPQFLPDAASEAQYSCRKWVSVNPMEAEVEPRSQLPVRYTVRVPAGAKEQSYHCAIGFISMPTKEDMEGIGVRTAVRVVSVLYPIVGQPAPHGEILGLLLEPVAAGARTQWRGVLVMGNSGQKLYRPQGQVVVEDAAGKVLETQDIASFPVLPRRKQRFLLPLKKELVPGRYTIRARVDVGKEIQEASAEVSTEAPKP
ncbi:MAG TPA: hypothetical protein VM120_20235 [Bryobacteraceae bacterium]|nr:hypothetical protein [Bryobacteraceae bacterium]